LVTHLLLTLIFFKLFTSFTADLIKMQQIISFIFWETCGITRFITITVNAFAYTH